ncbi:MAG TPA: recombinase family protein, partial [Gemmataceae bacterium]|nr:recombinase family protein [Gemmataceae bacterium]
MAASSTSTVAYSYIRFSSRQQAEGDSLRRQTEQAEAYCQRRGWTLDTSLTLRDLGVSAFRGDNALAGNLGKFLEQVKRGTVQTGSVLIVESFDRISRQGIDEGYEVVKRILKAGVRIVTLSPEREFDATATKSLSKGALEIQLILERAAEESETKSKRCAAAQAQKRKEARANGTVATAILPGWLTLRGGKIVEIPKRVAVVRSIFALASAGYGYHRIVKKLEGDPDNGIPAVPPFGKARHWCRSTLINMIRDRRVLGEYQPCKRTGKNSRVPDGEPIPNYYPAVITEAEWLAAQVRPMPKGGKRGRQGKHANLFVAGLLIDA